MKTRLVELTSCLVAVLSSGGALAESQCGRSDDFNVCVVEAVDLIHETREKGGYSDNYFTRDLDYGPAAKAIKASKPSETMCVAASAEILITALNIYYNNTNDEKPFKDLPASSWNGWSPTDIRVYIWEDQGSTSAGYAFARFGIGEKRDFPELKPGDFLSFDRLSGSGHSTVFMGYIDKDFNSLPAFSEKVAGFRYFSSQGTGAPGFAYRFAFFGGEQGKGVCKTAPESHKGVFVDCFGGGVSWNYVVGRGGRLWHPSKWQARQNIASIRDEFATVMTSVIGLTTQHTNQVLPEPEVRRLIEQELTKNIPRKVNPKFLRVD